MEESRAIRRLGAYREVPAPEALGPWAETAWSYARRPHTPPLPGRGHRILPHEGVNLLVAWRAGLRGRVCAADVVIQGSPTGPSTS